MTEDQLELSGQRKDPGPDHDTGSQHDRPR